MDVSTLRDEAKDILSEAVALRRTLHSWPELGNHLPATRETVCESLDNLPVDLTLHETTSGIAAVLEGGRPGHTVLLRADMDALPMPEDTGLDFASKVDGAMHACGHDAHTAMLVGAAKLLSARKADIPGRVLFMFQPGEEGFGGAKFMLEEGLLNLGHRADGTESPVTGAYALHITSSLPAGFIAAKGGPMMASSDSMVIRVKGRGGHASQPHLALDPIPVACEMVQALQLMVTRSVDVFDPSVVTIARITAGTTSNVIPEVAEIEGTIRAVSERTRTKVVDGLRRVVEGIASAHGCEVTIEYHNGYPVTVNDVNGAEFSMNVAKELIGEQQVLRMPNPVMGAEDFSYVLNQVPGSMMFLGATPHGTDPFAAAPNHSNRVYFEEDAMVNGMAVYAGMALRHLSGSR